jgi:GT2 family glycosyltransferase
VTRDDAMTDTAGGPAPDDAESPRISVVICAYTDQRWDDILAAVGSVEKQTLPPLEIILVVDHNPDLLVRLAAELPTVRVVENREERGLSGGKNTGVALARGEIVAFLDDDAVAEADWLRAMAAAYSGPDVVGVGGRTLPLWETGRPHWFPEEFDWVVGCTFVGRVPGRVRNLLGGNASFRRHVFDTVGGFPTGLGRTVASSRPLGCEETEFCIRVGQHIPGAVFLYEAGAVIGHRAPAARERFSYFLSRCYAEGLSKALVTRSVGVEDGLVTEREYVLGALRRGMLRGVRQGLRGETGGFARTGAIVAGLGATSWGYGVGRARTRRTARTAMTAATA